MALGIIVNGECKVRTGTGAAGALEDLGVSIDGVEPEFRDQTEPIFTDTFGPKVPFDEQQFLSDAIIRMQLIFFDDLVVGHCRSRPGPSDGQVGNAGALWGAGSGYFRLLLLSPTATLPYNFPKARLMDSAKTKIGTRRTIWDLTFYAVPYTGSSGPTSGNTLWNRTTT